MLRHALRRVATPVAGFGAGYAYHYLGEENRKENGPAAAAAAERSRFAMVPVVWADKVVAPVSEKLIRGDVVDA